MLNELEKNCICFIPLGNFRWSSNESTERRFLLSEINKPNIVLKPKGNTELALAIVGKAAIKWIREPSHKKDNQKKRGTVSTGGWVVEACWYSKTWPTKKDALVGKMEVWITGDSGLHQLSSAEVQGLTISECYLCGSQENVLGRGQTNPSRP